MRRLYLQHLIAVTPPAKLRVALESLATPEVRKRIQVDINQLLDHPDEIVPYFTNRDADVVLLLVGSVLKGQKVDPYNLTPAQQNEVKQALESKQVDTWIARKYKKSKAEREEVRRRRMAWVGWLSDGHHRALTSYMCRVRCKGVSGNGVTATHTARKDVSC